LKCDSFPKYFPEIEIICESFRISLEHILGNPFYSYQNVGTDKFFK